MLRKLSLTFLASVFVIGIGTSAEHTVPSIDEEVLDEIGVSSGTLQMVIRQAMHQLGPVEAIFSS